MATVYKLCDRGELPHVRVSNSIRVAPADLASSSLVTGPLSNDNADKNDRNPHPTPREQIRQLRLLTAAEVAERLGLSRATIYALCERGELPHVRVSNAIRVTPEDLEQFIQRQRHGKYHAIELTLELLVAH